MELGKKIRALRLKAGFTQEQLAEKLGIGAQSVSKWENGATMPDIASLPYLAEVFGVTIDDLFDLTVEQRFNRIEHRMDIEDNLLADHRADEAEKVLERLCRLEDSNPILNEVYRAHIALARFDEPTADQIIEGLLAAHPDDSVCLFEAAQYYAEKADYQKAIGLYERSFEKETRWPRFQDDLLGIRDIYEIMGDYRKAADTCDRILELLKEEWGITVGDDLKALEEKKASLLAKM